jgi:hypothetical protein
MNQFSERYKTLSTPELLKVIDTPSDYQALAVEAAVEELANRGLTGQEIADARSENESLELEEQLQKEKRKLFENKLKDVGAYIADAVNPVFETSPKTKRVINLLISLLGITFLIQLFSEFPMVKFLLTYGKATLTFKTSMLYFLPLIMPFMGAFLLWRSKILGWLLSAAFLISSAVIPLTIFFVSVFRHVTRPGFSNFADRLIAPSIGSMLFYGGCLWLIFRKDVREVYRIDKSAISIAVGLGIILTLFILVDAG